MSVPFVIRSMRESVTAAAGGIHAARVCGRQRGDGRWEGWVEFLPVDGSPALRTPRETTQPNREDLQYWAGGLTAVYLEGALGRALAAEDRDDVGDTALDVPAYAEPAPDPAGGRAPERAYVALEQPVLDPFAMFVKGEDYLRGRLDALSARHLRSITRFYGLASDDEIDLDTLTEAELAEVIVAGVRGRRAA